LLLKQQLPEAVAQQCRHQVRRIDAYDAALQHRQRTKDGADCDATALRKHNPDRVTQSPCCATELQPHGAARQLMYSLKTVVTRAWQGEFSATSSTHTTRQHIHIRQ
jgi:hypothetical protein